MSFDHSKFRKAPLSMGPLPSPQQQLRRNLGYIGEAKGIVDRSAPGSLKPFEQVYLDRLYDNSLVENRSVLSDVGSKERTLDKFNLQVRSRVKKATVAAGKFGKAVWTTSERIRQEEEARKVKVEREKFMRREFELTVSSHGGHRQHWHQNMSNPTDTAVRHSFGSYLPPGPQQRLFVANPNSRSTSTEGSLPDVKHSSGLYISSGPQQTPFLKNSNSRNTSTEGIPPSTWMGSNLSLSQQSAMTGSSGSGYYPRSGSVNTASLEDDGTHFSMGSRASGSSEMYQLDPSTGYYSGEPGSSRYPAMYNSGQEYYRNQTQMATPYSLHPPPPPHASTSTNRQGMYHHRSEDPERHHVQHDDAHKPRGHRSVHPEAKTLRR
ncbi:hypothetical protein EV359DRAFT_85165 [Lentinula novae-zelandiae]|nr:hypothetical protein EV359DRAFT_85165 [Lentinula novae-zelandiae]